MGNSRKGKRPKRQYHAAYHSAMGSKRKLARMGKKRKRDRAGLDATFIGRARCLKKLQISLRDFRRLCILKGIYPREPRGRKPGNKKGQIYYHVKDVRAVAHEPILEKFREFKAFMKKVRRAAGRNEKDLAARMDNYAPTYTLHHLVRERYPRFVDALSDLDDALALVYLFAALPSEGRIKARVTAKAKSLSAAWGAYCAATSAVTKNFVSVKGVYLEADVRGTPVRWVVPHSFTQHMPNGVDFRVMLTFFEFYETLLGFVLFKLYGDMGVRYPLHVSTVERSAASSVLAANLRVLRREVKAAEGSASGAVTEAVEAEAAAKKKKKKQQKGKEEGEGGKDGGDAKEGVMKKGDSSGKTKKEAKKAKALIKSVGVALNKVAGDDSSDEDNGDDDDDDEDNGEGIGAPLKAALESVALERDSTSPGAIGSTGPGDAHLNEEATKRRRLFAGLTFFLSREVPRGYVELVCLSYGGRVGWEGDDSPLSIRDPSITHHIIDRPKLLSSYGSLPKSREYVQPQWVLDSANSSFLLPCGRYGVGAELPPHLSPWVDNKEEGYTPAYAEEIERLKNGEVLPEGEEQEEGTSDEEEENMEAGKGSDEPEEDVEPTAAREEEDDDEESGSDEEDEERAKKRKRTEEKEEEEEKEMAKMMMSNKASRLYGRMQHGISQKQAKVDELHRRRREIEGKKKKKKGAKVQ